MTTLLSFLQNLWPISLGFLTGISSSAFLLPSTFLSLPSCVHFSLQPSPWISSSIPTLHLWPEGYWRSNLSLQTVLIWPRPIQLITFEYLCSDDFQGTQGQRVQSKYHHLPSQQLSPHVPLKSTLIHPIGQARNLEARKYGFRCRLLLLINCVTFASYLTSLSFCFLICNLGIIIVPTSWVIVNHKWVSIDNIRWAISISN